MSNKQKKNFFIWFGGINVSLEQRVAQLVINNSKQCNELMQT